MAEPAPRRSWMRWALVASLGLNLVFVGLIAGALIKGPPAPPVPGIGHYVRALPEASRRDLGEALRASRPDWSGMREACARREALAAALTAEPFEPAAVAALLEEDRGLAGRPRGARHRPPARRDRGDVAGGARRYAAALAEGPRRRHR